MYNEYPITQQEKENKEETSLPDKSKLPSTQIQNISNQQQQENGNEAEILWTINFDGPCNKTSAGIGVWIQNTNQGYSYKLYFPCTNNITEYEALILGLQVLKQLKAQKISILGDSELIIRQIKGEYSAKNPRLREYRNATLDLLKTFEKYELIFIPRAQNHLANELAFNASNFQVPQINEHLNIKVKNMPAMPENEDH